MKKKLFAIFGSGLLIGALFFGGYFAWAAIQSQVGINVFTPSGTGGTWFPVCEQFSGTGLLDGEAPASPAPSSCREMDVQTIPYAFNGTTWDRIRTVGVGDAAGTGIQALGGFGFNGTTWDRLRTATSDALAATGILGTGNLIFNGTTWDRLRSAADTLPNTGVMGSGLMAFNSTTAQWNRVSAATFDNGAGSGNTIPVVGSLTFNGTNWSRPREISANTLTQVTHLGISANEKGARTSHVSTPAAGTQATASKAAGGGTVRHVADCVSYSSGSTTAPALTSLLVNLRDGATGAGTIIWSQRIVISAATGENTPPREFCGLNLIGTANTAMTLEWSAGLANLQQAVTLTAYSVP